MQNLDAFFLIKQSLISSLFVIGSGILLLFPTRVPAQTENPCYVCDSSGSCYYNYNPSSYCYYPYPTTSTANTAAVAGAFVVGGLVGAGIATAINNDNNEPSITNNYYYNGSYYNSNPYNNEAYHYNQTQWQNQQQMLQNSGSTQSNAVQNKNPANNNLTHSNQNLGSQKNTTTQATQHKQSNNQAHKVNHSTSKAANMHQPNNKHEQPFTLKNFPSANSLFSPHYGGGQGGVFHGGNFHNSVGHSGGMHGGGGHGRH